MSATTIAEFGAKVPRIRRPSLGEKEAAIAANITEFVRRSLRNSEKPQRRMLADRMLADRTVCTARSAKFGSIPATLRTEAPEAYASVGMATQVPLADSISSHAFAAESIHADDCPAIVSTKRKAKTGRAAGLSF
ncbi:hypothetical protein ACFQX9_17040 [Bradyrhizobium sp. GCM10028915]|uniref:hypothetical protein n=1 Tax=Bradyrhizobium sp. GCM10028915 TaxID=3273385 RepID=UPI003613931B